MSGPVRGVLRGALRRRALRGRAGARGGLAALLGGLAAAAPGTALHAQQPGVDVLQYRFELTLPDRGKLLQAVSTVRFTRAGSVETLALDLLAPMRVTGALLGCGATATAVTATHDGRAVRVPLGPASAAARRPPSPAVAPVADTMCVSVRYEGEPADGLIISTDTAGRWRAFGDNWPDRGRHWLATVDHPSDKALVEFVVDAPSALTVLANGTRRGATDVAGRAGRRRTTWATAFPIPTYLMVIAAAPLTERDLGPTACGLGAVERCVPQSVWTAPEQARFMPGHFAEADSILSFFARTVGPFPYERLAHVQSSTRFGGMENAGAIFYADRLFRTPNGVGTGLIAHETAHQWFGDAVTEREWGHLWLSEGFATYFAALYTEHAQGDSAFRAEMSGIRDAVMAGAVAATRPVLDTAQTELLRLLNENSYQKGGFVLHMLRHQVGDSAFFRAVREYSAAFRHGNAETAHLQQFMQRASGQELGWFFDQWLRRPGWAEATLTWAHDPNRGVVDVTVAQEGRFPPYRLRIPVEVTLADGTRHLVHLDAPATGNATVTLEGRYPVAPVALRFDPAVSVLGRLRTP